MQCHFHWSRHRLLVISLDPCPSSQGMISNSEGAKTTCVLVLVHKKIIKWGYLKKGPSFYFLSSFSFLLYFFTSHTERKKKRIKHIFTSQLHDSIIRNTLLFKSQIQTQLIDFFFLHLILNPQSPT